MSLLSEKVAEATTIVDIDFKKADHILVVLF